MSIYFLSIDKFLIKILKIMLTFTAFSIDKEDFIVRSDILTFVIYVEAVRDSI